MDDKKFREALVNSNSPEAKFKSALESLEWEDGWPKTKGRGSALIVFAAICLPLLLQSLPLALFAGLAGGLLAFVIVPAYERQTVRHHAAIDFHARWATTLLQHNPQLREAVANFEAMGYRDLIKRRLRAANVNARSG